MRKNSTKNMRVNEAVREELSRLIRMELKDPRIAVVTSVTSAIVATDLKTCKVYISVLGNEKQKEETMKGLRSAEGFLRRMLAKNLNLRNTPELQFVLDESIEYGVHMTNMIDRVMQNGGMGKPADSGEDGDGDADE